MSDRHRLDIPRLVVAIAVCQIAGAIGGLATASSVTTWYIELRKAPLNPPGWVFGPVWAVLYTLMGVSLYRAWMQVRRGAPGAERVSFVPFFTQLLLNTAWSIVFFGLRQPFSALVALVVLFGSILMTIRSFAHVDRFAVRLLAPYAAWVAFAGYLNAAVWWLNRD